MMIYIIDIIDNVVVFRVLVEVIKDDFQVVVVFVIDNLVKRINEINFLLVLDMDIGNFMVGVWL